MNAKALIVTLIVVVIGAGYLMMALTGPLKDMNFGLGLTTALTAQKIAGGYNMANVVLFIIFAIIIAVLAYIWFAKQNKKS